jgi:hypothetical protein
MQFTIGTITRCAGGNHWHVPVTVNGVSHVLRTTTAELKDAGPDSLGEARSSVISRLRSALLEAGAETFPQAGAALNNKTFEV